MKARVIPRAYKKAVMQYLDENEKKQARIITRRIIKLMCYAINYHYDFGKKRLMRLLNTVEEISNDVEAKKDDILWDKIDMTLEKIGLEFKYEFEEDS